MTSKHWTEDELVAHLYGVGPEDGHLEVCDECSSRVRTMEETRFARELASAGSIEPEFDFLAAQRRRIYQRMSNPARYAMIWRIAPAAAASLVLALGVLLFQQQHSGSAGTTVRPTDAQLVEFVGGVAANPEPAPVAPLQALFEE